MRYAICDAMMMTTTTTTTRRACVRVSASPSASPLLPIERWIERAPGYRALCRWGTGGAAMNTSDYSFRFVWFITGNLI